MNLNYLAFFLIAFVPLLIGLVWYHPKFGLAKGRNATFSVQKRFSILQWILLFLFSFTLVYGYINLIIHQMGFYELFFTDIMKGSAEAQTIVDEFMGKYGNKHRHFGHGVFHGAINALVFVLPIISFFAMLENRGSRFVWYHFSYWLVTSILIGGLISAFV